MLTITVIKKKKRIKHQNKHGSEWMMTTETEEEEKTKLKPTKQETTNLKEGRCSMERMQNLHPR